MKIYSDVLDEIALHTAADGILRLPDVAPILRPKIRTRGWRVVTAGNGARWKNSGNRGADQDRRAATWDDHGRWMARLFILDARAVVGPYKGVEDFHDKTAGRYTADAVADRFKRANSVNSADPRHEGL